MSELGTTPPVTGAATPPGNDIKEKILAYERIVKLNSIVRVAFPLLVFSVIAVGIFSTWLTVSSAYNDKVVTEQTVKAGEELLPVLNKALRAFVDEVAPQLVEEFQTKLAASSERAAETLAMEIDRISKESMPFVESQAKAAILARKEEHKALLAELYPELKNDPAKLDATATKLNKAFEFWTVKYMTRTLEDYFLVMARINDTVVKHYRPKPGEIDPNKPKVAEGEMLELFMELLNAAYEYDPSAVPAPAEAAPEAPAAPVPAAEAAPAEAPAVEAAPAEAPVAEAVPAEPAPATENLGKGE